MVQEIRISSIKRRKIRKANMSAPYLRRIRYKNKDINIDALAKRINKLLQD